MADGRKPKFVSAHDASTHTHTHIHSLLIILLPDIVNLEIFSQRQPPLSQYCDEKQCDLEVVHENQYLIKKFF